MFNVQYSNINMSACTYINVRIYVSLWAVFRGKRIIQSREPVFDCLFVYFGTDQIFCQQSNVATLYRLASSRQSLDTASFTGPLQVTPP